MSNEYLYPRYEALQYLRAAIIRAAARCWHDKDFQNKLCDTSHPDRVDAALREVGCVLDKLGFKGFRIEFESPPHNDHFFEPKHTGGWVGAGNEFRLYLPPCPTRNEKAEALAVYNQNFYLLPM